MSLMLLSEEVEASSIRVDADDFRAAGRVVREVRVIEASYLTEGEGEVRREKMIRMYLGCSEQSRQ